MNPSPLNPFPYWFAGGPLLVPIALTCFALWTYFFRTRRALNETIHWLDKLDFSLHSGAPDLSVRPKGSGPVLPAIYIDSPSDALDACEKTEMPRLRRDLILLAALTASAPLFGLLGTVNGMIDTFRAVAVAGGETSTRVAAGISEALITTQFGLVVAIPGVFALARLRRLLDHAHAAFSRARSHLLVQASAGSMAAANSRATETHP